MRTDAVSRCTDAGDAEGVCSVEVLPAWAAPSSGEIAERAAVVIAAAWRILQDQSILPQQALGSLGSLAEICARAVVHALHPSIAKFGRIKLGALRKRLVLPDPGIALLATGGFGVDGEFLRWHATREGMLAALVLLAVVNDAQRRAKRGKMCDLCGPEELAVARLMVTSVDTLALRGLALFEREAKEAILTSERLAELAGVELAPMLAQSAGRRAPSGREKEIRKAVRCTVQLAALPLLDELAEAIVQLLLRDPTLHTLDMRLRGERTKVDLDCPVLPIADAGTAPAMVQSGIDKRALAGLARAVPGLALTSPNVFEYQTHLARYRATFMCAITEPAFATGADAMAQDAVSEWRCAAMDGHTVCGIGVAVDVTHRDRMIIVCVAA